MQVFWPLHAVEPFLLDDSVHPFGNGVVGGLVILGHADACMDGVEPFHVPVAAVLGAAVGVVYQCAQVRIPRLLYRLVQSGDGVGGHERVGERPADDLMREGVGDEVEVAHAVPGVYVGDVGHPQLVRGRRRELLRQVLVFAVVVVGVRRVPAALGLQHQMLPVQQLIELVTAHHLVRIQVPEHDEQLVRAYAGVLPAYLRDDASNRGLAQLAFLTLLLAHGIIAYTCLAKQPAQAFDRLVRMPAAEAVYCLAPSFFSKSMPYSSFPIFSSSRKASLRSSE